jgi:putative ABC transport system permease protein
MSVLNRKLFRDLWRLKWQMAAIALLVGCGVTVGVMAFSVQKALITAQRDYYRDTRFADVFATATRAPLSLVDDLTRIPGVVAVDARAIKAGLMEVPGLLRPATARLIALPDDDRRALNRIVVIEGRLPDPNRADEAVALKTFLDAAHVVLGERLSMVIGGHRLTFTIVGAALSPEYVYVPSNGPMPDDAHSGVFWAPRAAVERPAGLGGAFSAVSLALAPGTSTVGTIAAVDQLLARYGGSPAYARADQISHKFQQDRIDRMSVMATIIPPVFLIVAAALVHLVLARLVEGEREQVGLIKAFGYDDFAASSLYLKMAAVVGIIGAAAGGLVGGWLAHTLVYVLAKYMRFPHLTAQFSWSAFWVSLAFSVATAVGGSVLAVRRAVRLSPAVAMQPPAPAVFHTGVVERLRIARRFDQPTRMIIRHIERFPLRAISTAGGLGISLSLLISAQFMFGSFDESIDQAYYRARRWTDVIAFAESRDIHALAEATRLPAVVKSEPFRNVAAHLRANARSERVVVVGLEGDAQLERTLTASGKPIAFKGRGLTISEALAGKLHIQAGDVAELEITQGRYPRTVVPIGAVARDYAGVTVHMSRVELNRLMGDGDLVSGANLIVTSDRRFEFYRALARFPQIVTAGSRDDTVAMFRSAVAASMTIEMTFFLGIAGAIAFGIAYNITRVSLTERARDLATLRVLGFNAIDCAYILGGELVLLALIATPIGVAGGYGLAHALAAAFTRQDLYLPVVITPASLGFAVTVYLSAVGLALVLVAQRIWNFDLVAVLKTRD